MPVYVYECENQHRSEQYMRMADYRSVVVCECGALANRVFEPVNVQTFKPYVESNFNGKPIEITSAKQRDALCAKYSLTYDSTKYLRKPKFESAVEKLDYGVVKETINRGKLADGTPLDRPVRATEALD